MKPASSDPKSSPPTADADICPRPMGQLLSGKEGISASALAEHLGVTLYTIRKVAEPCGEMKLRYRSPFKVYDVQLAVDLKDHPTIVASRKRRSNPGSSRDHAAYRAAETRRARCAERMAEEHPEMRFLYESVVDRLWSPSTERFLVRPLYRQFPVMLWHALDPYPEAEADAIEIVVNILWAMTKTRTWKVNEAGEQDVPLSLRIWHERIDVSAQHRMYIDMFAAAIRHMDFDDEPKPVGRELALMELERISKRLAPHVAEILY
jgi:hypothetical protein